MLEGRRVEPVASLITTQLALEITMTIRDFLRYLSQHPTATALLDFGGFPHGDPTTLPMSDYKPELRPRSGKPWTVRHDALHMRGTKGGHQPV